MLTIMSFGHKYKMNPDCTIIDCRNIRNPFIHPTFKDKTWLDEGLQDYIIEDPKTAELLWKAKDQIGDRTDGMIAFGCTGGKHRSVVLAELFKDAMKDREVKVIHRDLEKL